MVMGSLIPGATYTYERIDGVVYATADTGEVSVVGYDYKLDKTELVNTSALDYVSMVESGSLHIDQVRQNQLWYEIRLAAQTNPTLQAVLNQAIMIYKLSKEYKDGNV